MTLPLGVRARRVTGQPDPGVEDGDPGCAVPGLGGGGPVQVVRRAGLGRVVQVDHRLTPG